MFEGEKIPYPESPTIGIPPRHQLAPADTSLGKVTLQIADLQRSLDFYTHILGLHVLSQQDNHATLGTKSGHELLVLREKKGVKKAPHRGRLGIYHFALLLPTEGDLGRFVAHVQGAGWHIGMSDHFYSQATYLQDPDGISIEVYRDRPRDQWVVTTHGEIVGSADALDLDSLKKAAGEGPWTGIPEGTVMGHLHFYIDDLKEGERFYHQGLGLSKVGWGFPQGLFVSAGGYHHHIGMNTWAKGSNPSSDDDARLLHWELVLPDAVALEATVQGLEAEGVTVTRSPEGTFASDPWGITVQMLVK
ncbi:VOC family protein [Deinococcus cellulosilyticus]|uniref:Catechol-2,3-dioxygenase n=1 Tax=Deinococcus cellulosilyticus (strain DSM 18568 / NBRC 106333 / KACC 11606 / 5516J-15) TaxID=1223518 RepID=A0A511N772_DEIC1|nr:VOC family protein [Deinococcus cellulosilyticus]GEM48680.1 catechol-2,3-dioxygenase [Deinococcus cellulosilyticus NBRC 106333 = KACC 11606]